MGGDASFFLIDRKLIFKNIRGREEWMNEWLIYYINLKISFASSPFRRAELL
jgi:hypothetical protein